MLLGRILGWLLLALALVALGGDGLRWLESGELAFIALQDFWTRLEPASLTLLQRLLPPILWDNTIQPLLGWPAASVLGGLGLILLLLFRSRPPRKRQRFGALA